MGEALQRTQEREGASLCARAHPEFEEARLTGEGRRFHDARHGDATYLLAAGVDMRTVMEILGHSNIATTANLYSHVLPQLKRAAADKIGGLLFEPVATAVAT